MMNHDSEAATRTSWSGDLRNIEPTAFAALGIDVVAYLKPVLADDKPGLEVHAADGRTLALIHDSRDVALAIIRQNDLEPVGLH